jgi:urea transporter
MLICRYLSEQLRQNIVLLGQQVVAICIAPRDAFILNSDACLFRLAWILAVFEMLMAAKLVSEVITRIGVSVLSESGTNLALVGSVVSVATGYGLDGVGIES